MANAFAPDIGMDIGGSNYSGRGVVDYSGVAESFANMFDRPKVTQTEASLKRERMIPFNEQMTKIDNSELSDAEKITRKNLYATAFVNANTDLSSEVKNYFGIMEEIQKSSKNPAYAAADEWASLEDNKTIAIGLKVAATDPNSGYLDEEKYYSSLFPLISNDAELAYNTKEVKRSKDEGEAVWNSPAGTEGSYATLYNLFQKDAEQRYNDKMLSSGLLTIGNAAKGPIDPAQLSVEVVIPIVEDLRQAKDKQGYAMDQVAMANKIDISSEKYKAEKESALSGFTQKINFLETNSKNIAKFAETVGKIKQTLSDKYQIDGIKADRLIEAQFIGVFGSQFGPAAARSQVVKDTLMMNFVNMSDEALTKLADSMAKGKKSLETTIASSVANQEGYTYSSLSTPQTVLDSAGNPTLATPGIITEKEKQELSTYTSENKKNNVDTAFAVRENVSTITTPEMLDHALASEFKMQNILQNDTKPLNPSQTKKFFSTDTLNLIRKVNELGDDNLKTSFNQKLDATSTDQLSKQWTELVAQVDAVNEAIGAKAFTAVVENNQFKFIIDPTTAATNAELRKVIRENNVKTADDLFKAFSKVTLTGSLKGASVVDPSKVTASLESINHITTTVMTLPPELQQFYQKTLSYSSRQMAEFNAKPVVTKFDATVSSSLAEGSIPENLKKYQPLFDQYFALEDQRKNLAPPAAGQAPDPQIKALADQMDKIRAKLPITFTGPDRTTLDLFRKAYDAKVNATNVETMSANPTRTIPLSEFLSSIGGVR